MRSPPEAQSGLGGLGFDPPPPKPNKLEGGSWVRPHPPARSANFHEGPGVRFPPETPNNFRLNPAGRGRGGRGLGFESPPKPKKWEQGGSGVRSPPEAQSGLGGLWFNSPPKPNKLEGGVLGSIPPPPPPPQKHKFFRGVWGSTPPQNPQTIFDQRGARGRAVRGGRTAQHRPHSSECSAVPCAQCHFSPPLKTQARTSPHV